MSIETRTAYTAICDGCGKSADDNTDWAFWGDVDGAQQSADNADYLSTDDGKHYCPDCSEWDEATDERVPRVPSEAAKP